MNGRDEGRWKSKPPDGLVSASPNKMEEPRAVFFCNVRQDVCARGQEAQNRAREKIERKTGRKGGRESSIETRRRRDDPT